MSSNWYPTDGRRPGKGQPSGDRGHTMWRNVPLSGLQHHTKTHYLLDPSGLLLCSGIISADVMPAVQLTRMRSCSRTDTADADGKRTGRSPQKRNPTIGVGYSRRYRQHSRRNVPSKTAQDCIHRSTKIGHVKKYR